MGLISFGSGSKGNSHLLKIGDTRILLDAGISPKKLSISRLETAEIDAVLITHEHQDHAKYVKDYINLAINCYMTEGTRKALKLGSVNYRVRIIKSGKSIKVKDFKITAFKSFHDAAEPVNFLIEGKSIKLVYITDTGKAPYKIKGLTHVIIEANYDKEIIRQNVENGSVDMGLYKRVVANHLSIDGAIEFLKLNDLGGVRKIYLTHLSDKNSDADKFKEKVVKLTGRETYVL